MENTNKTTWWGDWKTPALVSLAFSLGLVVGIQLQYKQDKDVAIKHGVGEYNSQTGDFQWKTNMGSLDK